ncbi:sulfurtransferase TusA family protein [Candidatus Colwellia aromaticivorans]|uniref:sulfurtransferase TusA family protein n=1 Tax=Candidatus Colwellia aromaticivorans TaxID=2267621 RepID=UPI000DF22D08|nr:sulfurtransferase TusA family protein [Candidatus Colwellia aromaticivorans]
MIFEYDASDEKCPLPLVNLRLQLKKMQKGDICLLTIADKGSIEDIPKLLNKLGYSYNQSLIDNGRVKITISSK